MKLVFVTEARFTKGLNGNVYGDSSFNYKLWERYLQLFSEVIVLARVNYNKCYNGNNTQLSSGSKVSFIELPYYIGPLQYLKQKKRLKTKIKQSVESNDAVFICRVPGTIGNIAAHYLNKKKITYGVEVVGDPWDVFAKGSVSHPMRIFFRWKGLIQLKKNVINASAALYVTSKTLQERYPVSNCAFQISASDVILKDDLIAVLPKKHVKKKQYTIISVGSLEQMYKAPDIVLKSISKLNSQGMFCNLIWLGDGYFKEEMRNLSISLGIENHVEFKGNVTSEKVREYLSLSDIFVLASRTEGLPRALIEAMAVGLPCIGTNVGGIPELIDQEMLIPKDSSEALSIKILDLIENPNKYNEQATNNLRDANSFKESVLKERRKEFYEYLINLKK